MSKRRQLLTSPPGLDGIPPEHWPGARVCDAEGGELRPEEALPLALPPADNPDPTPDAQ